MFKSLLPQPPSFNKKKHYDVHEILGEGTFGKVVKATWRVPGSQVGLAEHGAAASNEEGDGGGEDSGIRKDVALKVIPKKKVKGNEASVWGEMEVLKGLDHPNIVSPHLFLFVH